MLKILILEDFILLKTESTHLFHYTKACLKEARQSCPRRLNSWQKKLNQPEHVRQAGRRVGG